MESKRIMSQYIPQRFICRVNSPPHSIAWIRRCLKQGERLKQTRKENNRMPFLFQVYLTFSSPLATLQASSTTLPAAMRDAVEVCDSFQMVSLSTCKVESQTTETNENKKQRKPSCYLFYEARLSVVPGTMMLSLL